MRSFQRAGLRWKTDTKRHPEPEVVEADTDSETRVRPAQGSKSPEPRAKDWLMDEGPGQRRNREECAQRGRERETEKGKEEAGAEAEEVRRGT